MPRTTQAASTYTEVRTVYSFQFGTRIALYSDRPWPLLFRFLFRLLGFRFFTLRERVQVPNEKAFPE